MSATRFPEIATASRVLRLARGERRAAALVAGLGLVAAIFEGVGLSFLIPLATVATVIAIRIIVFMVVSPVLLVRGELEQPACQPASTAQPASNR